MFTQKRYALFQWATVALGIVTIGVNAIGVHQLMNFADRCKPTPFIPCLQSELRNDFENWRNK
jgi:hypothetical protein